MFARPAAAARDAGALQQAAGIARALQSSADADGATMSGSSQFSGREAGGLCARPRSSGQLARPRAHLRQLRSYAVQAALAALQTRQQQEQRHGLCRSWCRRHGCCCRCPLLLLLWQGVLVAQLELVQAVPRCEVQERELAGHRLLRLLACESNGQRFKS